MFPRARYAKLGVEISCFQRHMVTLRRENSKKQSKSNFSGLKRKKA